MSTTPGTLSHKTPIVGANNPAYPISATAWNQTIVLASAAADGSVFVRDSTQTDGWGFIPSLLPSQISNTDVGTQNDWTPAPGILNDTLIEWAGVSSISISGLAGGTVGQHVVIKNINAVGSGIVAYCLHSSVLSAAGHRFANLASSAPTPIAPGGWIAYVFDGSNWAMVGHDQGDWITSAFSAGNFLAAGAMTWTVTGGQVILLQWKLRGKDLTVGINIQNSTTGGVASAALSILSQAAGGFTLVANFAGSIGFLSDGTYLGTGVCVTSAGNLTIQKATLAVFALVAAITVQGTVTFPVV